MPEASSFESLLEHPLKQPQSKTEMFIVFTLLALQGVGGVLAVAQRELVERRRWMTKAQFVEEWSVAQVMPGPNIVNLSLMLGGQVFWGFWGHCFCCWIDCRPHVFGSWIGHSLWGRF